jgi:hypothetical protein
MRLYPTSNVAEFPIGNIIQSAGSPGAGWVLCDGSNYLKSNYPDYINGNFDLHPLRFHKWEKFWFTNTPAVQVKSVAINGAIAVMVGGTTRYHWRSSDSGENWTEYSTNLPASGDWRVVEYANSQFVAAAYGGTQAAYSSDGITWNSVTLPVSGNWDYLIWDGTQWLLCATGSGNYCTSSNGSSWTSRTGLPFINTSGIAVDLNNNELMIISYSSSPTIYHSTDGINWTNKEYFQYMLRPYDTGAYPANVMYFPDSDKWVFMTDEVSYSANSAWESFDDGDTWGSIWWDSRFKMSNQSLEGGAKWDGDCWIQFSVLNNRGYYMKDGNSFFGFACPAGDDGPPYFFDCEYENYMLLLGWDTGESLYDYVYKLYYGDYDPSTRFCVPQLTGRMPNGFHYYIRLQ